MLTLRRFEQLMLCVLLCLSLGILLAFPAESVPLHLQPSKLAEASLPWEVEWRVPVGCGFSGFFVEVVLGFIPPLAHSGKFVLLCGECDESFLSSLTPAEAAAYRASWADEAARSPTRTRRSVVIEHGDPCGMRSFGAGVRPRRVISRSMSEGDLSAEAANCLTHADEVWVPTEWHVERFAAAGVPTHKLVVIPEPIDVHFWSPAAATNGAANSATNGAADARSAARASGAEATPFVFFSNFKWEYRKVPRRPRRCP